jgi:dihydropteroate synthase
VAGRTLLRPTGFIDSPFGRDGHVERLAQGLTWFTTVELLPVDGGPSEFVPVGEIEERLDDDMAMQWQGIIRERPALTLGARTIRFDQPQVMGILNVTPDSFSDGGKHVDARGAIEAGAAMSEAGAAIIDIGGESTRPGARPVWEGDEIERIEPVLRPLANSGAAVSIDTRKAVVMRAAIAAGATMVNDVSALTWDHESAETVAEAGVPVILMHHQGKPETMQDMPHYPRGVLVEVFEWLEQRIATCVATGIKRERILIDPGFGFGKTVAHNLELMNGLALFHGLGCPIVVGASRKRTIGALHKEAPPERRLAGSLAFALKAVEQGAQIVRVHDVYDSVQALKVWRGLRDQALTPRFR